MSAPENRASALQGEKSPKAEAKTIEFQEFSREIP
jgi:hypothetical protein